MKLDTDIHVAFRMYFYKFGDNLTFHPGAFNVKISVIPHVGLYKIPSKLTTFPTGLGVLCD